MNNEIFPLQHPATNTCAQASLVSCCLKVFLFLGILIGFIIPCAIGNESVQKPAEGNASGTGEIVSFSVPIKEKRVYVYAGPGENFYPTTILEQGDIVEVFTRNANGWCAIRPPNGSFSWVNKRFVRIDQDNIGIIVCENHGQTVPVRVGADSIMESSVIQIGLENGKKVRIKGETRLPGGTVWCKVSPPAGEFRYIHENFLEEVETIQQVPDRLMLKREYLEAVMGDIIESPTPAPVSPLPLALPSMPGIAGVPFASSDQSSKTIFQQPPVLQVPDFTDDAGKMPTFPVTPSTTIAERVRDNVGRPQTPSTLGNPLAPLSGPNYKFPVWDPQSFDDNFSLEVARLNRDLFAVVSRGGTDEVYNLLSERAITLFDIAGTDDQRTVVQTLHHKINRFRYGDTGTEMIPAQAVPAQKMNESAAAIVLNPPPHRGEAEVKKSPDHLRFAFAAENSPLKPGRGRTPVQVASLPQAVPPKAELPSRAVRGWQLLPGSRSTTIVPPADYQQRVPTTDPVQAPKELPVSEPSVSEPSVSEPIILSVITDPIRQTTAVVAPDRANEMPLIPEFPTNDESTGKYNIATWQAPKTKTTPETAVAARAQGQGFDAMGILGYLADAPKGYPPYALVEQMNGQTEILCYLRAESGESLDPFIGKMVGVKGIRGHLQKEGESQTVITARTIFTLK